MQKEKQKALTTEWKAFTEKSILRYPWGKTLWVKQIVSYFPSDLTEMCSPFFGGWSIELHLAAKWVKVYGYDLFTPLVEFWQSAHESPELLADTAVEYYPVTKEKFKFLQRQQNQLWTKLDRAAAFFVLNRTSFSGTTLSGGMSPLHAIFSTGPIERLRRFYNPNVSIEALHFAQSIPRNKKTFLYLDPPYLISSALYGNRWSTHRHFDHYLLFHLLSQRDNWILSYNDCKEIRDLYKDYKMVSPKWKYSLAQKKESRELLIFSRDRQP